MYDHAWITLIIVAQKMSDHCSVVIVFDVIDMTLESISYSVLSLAYIFDMATLTFQAIYEVIALTGAFSNSIVGCVVVEVSDSP